MQTISMEKVKKDLLSSDFYLNCNIPLGYTAGFPILKIMNGCLCVTIPYLRYQTTGEVDKTLVYPLRYGITLELPTLQVVAFENYEYAAVFQTVDFEKPVGLFRHETVKQYSRKQYQTLVSELMQLYDKVIAMILGQTPYQAEVEKRMSKLLQILVEPSLRPMYRALDIDFYNKYIESEN